ncbi:MAG: hypothetical protein ACRCXZ_08215 [Patescibacteria group bacterium]
MILANLFFYSSLVIQGVINGFFHLNWIKRPTRLPKILIGAYTFAFLWYITSTLYYLGKMNFSININTALMDNFALLSVSTSLVLATYYLLTLKPVSIPVDNEQKQFFVFPIHLIMYIALIVLTGFFNIILSLFI